MIDLRKPLEGIPGLLLMAALILFGTTIGIGVAIVFKWLKLNDGLLNFLGGVVGAGLGAALAVLGAVYVQRLGAEERARPTLHLLASGVSQLSTLLGVIHLMIDAMAAQARSGTVPTAPSEHLDTIERTLGRIPEGADLEFALHNDVLTMKELVMAFIHSWRTLERAPVAFPLDDSYYAVLDMARSAVQSLQERVPSLDAPNRIGRPA